MLHPDLSKIGSKGVAKADPCSFITTEYAVSEWKLVVHRVFRSIPSRNRWHVEVSYRRKQKGSIFDFLPITKAVIRDREGNLYIHIKKNKVEYYVCIRDPIR